MAFEYPTSWRRLCGNEERGREEKRTSHLHTPIPTILIDAPTRVLALRGRRRIRHRCRSIDDASGVERAVSADCGIAVTGSGLYDADGEEEWEGDGEETHIWCCDVAVGLKSGCGEVWGGLG